MDSLTIPNFTLTSFAAGKNTDRNEDTFGFNADTIVLSDGATDKTGILYEQDKRNGTYKTGGEIAANLVVQTALASHLNGKELVDDITQNIKQYYTENNTRALDNSAYRFFATMVVVRIVGTELVITQVGDTAFRINNQNEYKNDKQVDHINSDLRKKYIESTGDIPGGREHILPRLQEQHKLQNNGEDALGFGCLDGSPVPAKFVHTFTFPLSEIKTIELVTDGYFGAFPTESTIDAYEKLHSHIETIDPYKIDQFASTKTTDDRTVLIAKFIES